MSVLRVNDLPANRNQPLRDVDKANPNELVSGPAAVLISKTLPAADVPFSAISDSLRDAVKKNDGKPITDLSAAVDILKGHPQLKSQVGMWASRLCNLQPKILETDQVEIEFVTTVALPIDRGTARRWTVDPLTAFLDLIPDAKAVQVENNSWATKNGMPLTVSLIQRGDDPWLQDLANTGYKFDGHRTKIAGGPEGHDAALAGLKDLVLNVEAQGVLVSGTQPKTLYDYGSVVTLTAYDAAGEVLAVATVKPKNVNRTVFTRGGQPIRTDVQEGIDTTGPTVDLDRVKLEMSLIGSQAQRASILAAGADAPSRGVRMDAKLEEQAITEAGAAVEFKLNNETVVASEIPFSTRANIPASGAEEAHGVHRYFGGATLGAMMNEPAQLHAQGTDVNGKLKGDGQPVAFPAWTFALPERSSTTVAGVAMAEIPYNNVGLALTAPDGVRLQDHLKTLGLEVRQEKIANSTDQVFHVEVDSKFVESNGKLAVDVGFRDPSGNFVWASENGDCSTSKPNLQEMGRKGLSYQVRVPDSVYRNGGQEDPAPMYVRFFRPESGASMPVFLGAASFDMKGIGLARDQLSTPDQIWAAKKEVEANFNAAKQAAVSAGKVIAEPVSARDLEKMLEKGGAFAFNYAGHNLTVEMDEACQNAIVKKDGNPINVQPNAVIFNTTDDNAPNGHFVVSLQGIVNGQALYFSKDDGVRQAPFPLPAAACGEGVSPRAARLETLMARDAEDNSVYPNLLWEGLSIHGECLNSDIDRDRLLDSLEQQRQEAFRALRDAAAKDDCIADGGKDCK